METPPSRNHILSFRPSTLCLSDVRKESRALLEFATCCPNPTHLDIFEWWMSNDALNIPAVDEDYDGYIASSHDVARLIANITGSSGTGKLKTLEAKLTGFGKESDSYIWIWRCDSKVEVPLRFMQNIFAQVKKMPRLRQLYIDKKQFLRIKKAIQPALPNSTTPVCL
ncbi:hypothetical protein BGX26_001411 [Mortierella sp. AD094]|nr:hypothetical protein BGX26_001411 [Mortierella sp. AD094]